MLINFLRSSSYSNWDFCQQQYFINYVLGIPRTAGVKAAVGTATHKVLECLANIKKHIQNTGEDKFTFTDEIGKIDVSQDSFLYPRALTNIEIEDINKTRINKSTYLDDCKLEYGHKRLGIGLVEKLIEMSCDYYDEGWSPVDRKNVRNFVWMELDYQNGMFDPRKRNIIAAEPHFDFEIDREWAICGAEKLRIKGTIDLITEVEEGIIEVIDFKTGKRIDWTSTKDNDVKTYDKLCKDFQLMLYYYAARKMFPDVKQIMVTIFWVRDGGPFTVCFDDQTLLQVEDKIRNRLEEIKHCDNPEMLDPEQRSFKCTYICDYYKMPSPNGKTNMCKFLKQEVDRIGMDEVVKLYTNEGFVMGHYEAPGESA